MARLERDRGAESLGLCELAGTGADTAAAAVSVAAASRSSGLATVGETEAGRSECSSVTLLHGHEKVRAKVRRGEVLHFSGQFQ
jgi:hypothetical protein